MMRRHSIQHVVTNDNDFDRVAESPGAQFHVWKAR
jgi:predicted nucleic acid-binding protein